MAELSQITCPSPLVNLPSGTLQVEDADEEIADLYMRLAILPSETGLGYLDTSKSVLELEMELKGGLNTADNTTTAPSSSTSSPPSRRMRQMAKKAGRSDRTMTIPVTIHQDLAMLKGRKGDTVYSGVAGALWYLAQHLLTQYHYPPSNPSHALFTRDLLSRSHIIELGSGTGMLAILLSDICGSYTATDLYDNLRLVSRNLEINRRDHGRPTANKNVKLEELDWVSISRDTERDRTRGRLKGDEEGYDLIMAVDCIYNEYLVKPFVDTLSSLCRAGSRSVVLVVVELRSADVLTVFLEEWLRSGTWQIVRVPSESLGLWSGHPGRWVGWIGWRT